MLAEQCLRHTLIIMVSVRYFSLLNIKTNCMSELCTRYTMHFQTCLEKTRNSTTNLSLVQNHNFVTMQNCIQSVCNSDNCTVSKAFKDCLLDESVCRSIDISRCLIQQKDLERNKKKRQSALDAGRNKCIAFKITYSK